MYKEMYVCLFSNVTEAIRAIQTGQFTLAEKLLKEGQLKAEDIYVEWPERLS
jgi:hypothetical protein